ncbi:hypothetical protein A2U01_0039104 [Trifolium medium]|uniref:Uncharacterized protein n=1 Tax=Trifolium medium TaxID=97028 RepID=A0A392Q0L2_9FABA|nr:hypothetical protein [Trifolium medium]
MWCCTNREQEHDRGDRGAASLLGCSSTTTALESRGSVRSKQNTIWFAAVLARTESRVAIENISVVWS